MTEVTSNGTLREAAEILKALGHPVRLKIMMRLAERCCCVREIWENLQLPQAVVSQHLKILKDHKVLETHREGVKVCYRITDGLIRDLVTALDKNVTGRETASI